MTHFVPHKIDFSDHAASSTVGSNVSRKDILKLHLDRVLCVGVNIDRQNQLYDVCRGFSILGRSFFTGLCMFGVVSPPIGRSNCLGGWGVHCVVAEMHLMMKLFAEIVGVRLYSVCPGLVSNIGRQFSLHE